ncbi:HAMP domain-containing histidine kinase [Pseudanabaena sp. PCC 6802]|uniref:HAMP domain-containing histidine kinase n=1 Tax=Pseudanabaena sp. PCC 6802 TaxID=118173 RepID=UPI0003626BBE|nr:HAMP domain-containing histidine kinase [Pseudanabaena sp. PCC 6802]
MPFVLQIVGVVGLTGWLAWRNSQQAIEDLGSQLRDQVSKQVQMYLSHYLERPDSINHFNEQAVRLGQIKLDNSAEVERYLWNQIQLFHSVSFIQFGTETGEFIGVERLESNQLNIAISGKATGGVFSVYATDGNGNRNQLVRSIPNYDPRKRPWYIAPIREGKSAWSPIYVGYGTQKLTIAKGLSLYSGSGQFLGVTAVDLSLAQIDEFLQELKIGRTGRVFLLERSGDLIADSTPEKPYAIHNGRVQRIAAKNSANYLLKAAFTDLSQKVGDLNSLKVARGDDVWVNGDRILWQAIPFQDGTGIDWLILIAVPASDFTQEIDNNNRNTLMLCLLSLGITIVLGNFTARKIAKPLLHLCDASRAIAEGKLNQDVGESKIEEIHVLSQSFNQMSDRLQKADRLKTDFLSNISHELRTPLVSILGFTKVIDKKFDDVIEPLREVEDKKVQKCIKQIKENLGIVRSESQRLTDIITNVLDITNLEAGKVAWNMQSLNLGELLTEIAAQYQPQFQNKELSLDVKIPPYLPKVTGDRDRILQVMSNLLSNALKFTQTGGVICRLHQDGDLVVFSVKDTGIGISKEDSSNVFEKFKQVGDVLTGKPQGTGLGLPICKAIVTHHGGRIWFESTPGQGSTFVFTLPI